MIFQGIRSSPSKLLFLLKIRTFKWIQAFNGLHKDLENLWNVNSIGEILLFNKQKGGLDPIWWSVEFIGFLDGAWERSGDDISLSGIGG